MQKTNNLQEIFLTQVRRDRRPVTIFLMNGFQMRGYVTGFDAFKMCIRDRGNGVRPPRLHRHLPAARQGKMGLRRRQQAVQLGCGEGGGSPAPHIQGADPQPGLFQHLSLIHISGKI